MRIAILSMQRVVNFGSVLQAYSLREMVREIAGDTPFFMEIEDQPSLESVETVREAAEYTTQPNYSSRWIQRGKRWCIARLSAFNKHLIRRFMQKELRLGVFPTEQTYDCVIVGSDEVFNHAKGVRLQLHGEINQARHLISYAASCGSAKPENVRPEDVGRLKAAMSRFEALSVRDSGTEAYAEYFGSVPVVRHMDPVLMGRLAERQPGKVWLKRYLLVYAYGQRIHTAEEIDTIRKFARSHSLKIVAMGGSQFWCDLYIPASPMRMLDWFYHADYVVTDTFHGVIFSVINHKQFAAIVRPSNANKLTSLLTDLELSERRVVQMNLLPQILRQPVAYEQVDAILTRERGRTREYLKEQLKHAKGKD